MLIPPGFFLGLSRGVVITASLPPMSQACRMLGFEYY